MSFLLAQRAFGEYRWTLRAARVQSAISPGYRSLNACASAVDNVKRNVRSAPVVDRTVKEPGATAAAALTFALEKSADGGFRWSLLARNGRRVAASPRTWPRKAGVRAAITSLRNAAPAAPVDAAPVVCAFRVEPVPARWGATIKLRALGGTAFGSTEQQVWLLGADRLREQTRLTVTSWADDLVEARLPPAALFTAPHAIEVRGLLPLCEAPILFDAASVGKIADDLADFAAGIELAIRERRVRNGQATAVAPRLVVLNPGERLPLALRNLPSRRLQLAAGQSVLVRVEAEWTVDEKEEDASFERTDDKTTAGFLEQATYAFVPALAAVPGDVSARRRRLRVALTLEVAGVVQPIALPLDLDISPVVLPKLAVLYNHKEFSTVEEHGQPPCLLILYPEEREGAPTETLVSDVEGLSNALAATAKTFSTLPWLPDLPTMVERIARFATGLRTVKTAHVPGDAKGFKLTARPNPQGRLDFVSYYWDLLFHLTAEDSCSSILLLGMPGDALTVYYRRSYESHEGRLGYRILERRIMVEVPVLHGKRPEPRPAESLVDHIEPPDTFNDRLSSVHFGLSG